MTAPPDSVIVFNRPKKVLIVTAAYLPKVGGQATYAKLLKDQLPAESGGKVRAIIQNSGGRRYFRRTIAFLRTLYYGRYCDLVYALDPVDGAAAAVAAKWLKKPFWFKLSADSQWEAKTDEQKKAALKRLLGRADLVLAPSQESILFARTLGLSDDRIFFLPNAFDAPNDLDSRTNLRKKWKVAGQIVIAAGRLVARKNFPALIELWPAVLNEFPDAKLLIAGEGPEKERLDQLIAERGLSDSVLLSGPLERSALYVYEKMANVFVHPSLYEVSSQALLEARAFGLPILALDTGDNRALLARYDQAVIVEKEGDFLPGLLRILASENEAVEVAGTDTVKVMLKSFLKRLATVV